jgi:outer membrane protein
MKKIISAALFLGFIALLPFQVGAADIAVIDLQAILQQSDPGKKAMQELQNYQKGLRSELKQEKRSLDQLRKELQQQSMMLSEEAKQNKQSQFRERAQKFQSKYQRYQQQLKKKEQEIREPIIDILMNIIQEYGKNHDHELIIDKKNSGIMFNKDKLEITDTIIQRLNKAWKKQDKEIKSP